MSVFRGAASILLAALGVGAGAWVALRSPDASPAAVPTLVLAGETLAPGAAGASAVDAARRYGAKPLVLVLPGGREHVLHKGELAVQIDRVRQAKWADEVASLGEQAKGGERSVPVAMEVTPVTALGALTRLKSQLDIEPLDASVDLEARRVRPETIGFSLDVYGTIAAIEAALQAGQDRVTAAGIQIRPKVLASDLGAIDFRDVLGYFETKYNQGIKYRDRTYNLRQASSKIHGHVVMPGELFDFNAVVGPRDEAHGYRVATVIAQGELVDGLGGGTCQVSGTLHAAVFFSGLEIVERYSHSRPSGYIKLGLDATVSYPNINYRFKNTFPFPIVLRQTVADGVVRAEVLGPVRKNTVSFFRRIDEIQPFEVEEKTTDKLAKGKRVTTQRGVPGFVTTTVRVAREGAQATRDRWNTIYPPTTEIIAVGTGAKTASGVTEDEHPEYVADEYLVVTQGPDVQTPGVVGPESGGGTTETREPGKSGRYGWMEEMGFRKKDPAASKARTTGG